MGHGNGVNVSELPFSTKLDKSRESRE